MARPTAPLDFLTGPLRSVLGIAETDLEQHSPLHDAAEMQQELREAVIAIHRAADSMERHVAVVETLASSVPALTDSVNALVRELNGLLGVLAPLSGAEREVSRVEHFFGRRRRPGQVSQPGGQDPPSGGG